MGKQFENVDDVGFQAKNGDWIEAGSVFLHSILTCLSLIQNYC